MESELVDVDPGWLALCQQQEWPSKDPFTRQWRGSKGGVVTRAQRLAASSIGVTSTHMHPCAASGKLQFIPGAFFSCAATSLEMEKRSAAGVDDGSSARRARFFSGWISTATSGTVKSWIFFYYPFIGSRGCTALQPHT